MTGLLQEALKRIELRPLDEQDAIASQIIEALDDEEGWQRNFLDNRDHFRALAREAVDERAKGETRPLDELFE